MRKLIAVLAVFLIGIVSVAATDMVLDPQWTHIDHTEDKPVAVCVEKSSGGPYPGLVLTVTKVCMDRDHDEACDDGTHDILNPAEFWVTVTASPTDENGCGQVTLHTADATGGIFVYQVNGATAGGVSVDAEYGGAYIPEFTAIGAGIALVGAGIYAAKKRKE